MAKRRIAVLGGGMGAMAAAWQLTSTPELRDRFEVTVYQLGWRLGGKGASGRDPRAQYGTRILEHGLHVWGGFYENAFRVMRECYREAARPAGTPLSQWYDPNDRRASAFWPQHHVTVEENVDGEWLHWSVEMPSDDELPGDGTSGLPSPWDIVRQSMELLAELVQESRLWQGSSGGTSLLDRVLSHWSRDGARASGGGSSSQRARKIGKAIAKSMGEAPTRRATPAPGLLSRIGRTLGEIGGFSEDAVSPGWSLSTILSLLRTGEASEHSGAGPLHELLSQFHHWLAERVERELEMDDALRRLWIAADLLLAHARGLVADGCVVSGLEAINDSDWAEWLGRHGASKMTLESPLVRGIYDYVFGYLDGDVTRPRLEAGTAVHGIYRLGLTYKGAIFWEMQSGMGDAVFVPLYQALAKRGVRFAFFHAVRSLELSPDRASIDAIRVGVQATPKSGSYQPFVDVGGVPCWPDRPLYQQLREGDELESREIDLESAWTSWPDVSELVLKRGEDFDDVVLGISLGALPSICAELIAAEPRWKKMVTDVKLVQTQAMQLWLTPDRVGLGWQGPTTILSAYAEPFATWGDLSHLETAEAWPPGRVGSIAYFCGPLPTMTPGADASDFAERVHRAVRSTGRGWLERFPAHLWPAAANGPGLDWSALVDPEERSGADRLDAQYFRGNVNPSDCYVLSVPGSGRSRLPAGDTGFANLVIAGDWVETSINAGCIEAATMAGLAAADALIGKSASVPELAADRLVYVERGGEQVYRQPLVLHGCDMRAFVLEADMAALQRLCDLQLNGPARGRRRYLPLVPRVLLAFAAIDRATSADARDSQLGWISEIDVAFWVPLAVLEVERGRWQLCDVAWHLPYVFVDNPWAMATGREIYGFHKQLGQFAIPSRNGDGAYSVSALVLPEHAPESRAETRTVLEVRRQLGSGAAEPTVWSELGEAARELRQAVFGAAELLDVVDHLSVDGLSLAVNLLDYAREGKVPMVFLKQLRDAADPTRACYQRIVEACANMHEGSFRGAGPLLGDYRLSLADWASHPIARELGLRVGDNPIAAALWTKFSFTMEPGEEL